MIGLVGLGRVVAVDEDEYAEVLLFDVIPPWLWLNVAANEVTPADGDEEAADEEAIEGDDDDEDEDEEEQEDDDDDEDEVGDPMRAGLMNEENNCDDKWGLAARDEKEDVKKYGKSDWWFMAKLKKGCCNAVDRRDAVDGCGEDSDKWDGGGTEWVTPDALIDDCDDEALGGGGGGGGKGGGEKDGL
jgi:hypothetical protein